MRHLQQVYTDYLDRGVAVLGINGVDDREIAVSYLKELGITFPNVLDASEKADRALGKYQTLEGLSGVPLSYVIDRQGRVADAWYGGDGSVVAALENCLAGSRCSRVQIRIEGFSAGEGRDFALCLQEDREGNGRYRQRRIGPDGVHEESRLLKSGPWIASFVFGEAFYAVRRFEILAGKSRTITIQRKELSLAEPALDLAGSLTYPDGSPLPDYGITLFGYNVPGLEMNRRVVQSRTDENGRFHVKGLKPGHWWVRASIEDHPGEAITSFRDLFLPAGAENPYPLHLTFPRGKVKGLLCDAATGRPLDRDKGQRWWIFLNDLDRGWEACELQNGHVGSRFEIPGVRAGRYRIVVMVPGAYQNFETRSFTLDEGRELDLGKILLIPAE
jgi:hypothetical protein